MPSGFRPRAVPSDSFVVRSGRVAHGIACGIAVIVFILLPVFPPQDPRAAVVIVLFNLLMAGVGRGVRHALSNE